jgi:tRNA(Ile)-lysidine synthase
MSRAHRPCTRGTSSWEPATRHGWQATGSTLGDHPEISTVIESVENLIRRARLVGVRRRVLVMLSGGADSTLLVVVLAELGYTVRALHVQHALRGDESAADEAFCVALCRQLGVELRVENGSVPTGANLEARLRTARRDAAVRHGGRDPIATGHTASDRAETVLYRLATSGGTNAVTALPARAGPFIRPLLDLTRDEIRIELRRRNQGWRDDASNAGHGPARNRIRHEVLPVLTALNPQATRNINRTAQLAADDRDLIDSLAAGLVDSDGVINLDQLAAAHPAAQRAALRIAAARHAITLGHNDIEALRTLGRAGSEQRSLPGGVIAQRAYNTLLLVPGAPNPSVPASVVVAVPSRTAFGSFEIITESGTGDALDASLAHQLVARGWRRGDRLDGHHHTCAELLARARVPRPARPGYPVIEADGEPVALAGLAIGKRWRREQGIVIRLLPMPAARYCRVPR